MAKSRLVHAVLISTLVVSIAEAGWLSDWFSHDSHSYRLTDAMDWDSAQSLAMSVDGNLASIESAEENQWVFDTFYPLAPAGSICPSLQWQGLWVGGLQAPGSSEPDEGWSWIGAGPVVFAAWAPGEPNESTCFPGDPENKILINPTGQWNDASAIVHLAGVVEVVPEPTMACFFLLGLSQLGRPRF